MRILKVTQSYFPYLEKGGPAVKVRAVAEHLTRRGHDVAVLTSRLGPLDARGLPASRVRTKYLRSVARYRSTTINPGVVAFCMRELRGFDVVHLYGLYDLLGPVVAAFCRRWGIPYVIEPMGMHSPIVRSLRKKRLYHRVLGQPLVDGAAALIATADEERAELVASGIAAARVVVRRNGVDLEEFADLPAPGAFRRRLGIRAADPLIVAIGRISRKKGLDLLMHALAELPSTVRAAIVGPDDRDGCLQELERLRRDLDLVDRVFLLGPLFGTAKHEALVDADVFALPSRNENFGNAAAEAVACGTPVVVTDRCGIASLVAGRAGLVTAYDCAALRDGLFRILHDSTLLAHLRDGCAPVARELSWAEPITAMEELYRAVAGEPSPPS